MIKASLERVQRQVRKGVFTGLRWAGHRSGKTVRNLPYGRAPEQVLDLYLPADGDRGTQVVFIHGGGWRSGSKDEYAYLGAALAAFGITCAVVGYRLYPEVRYPVFVEDVAHAIGWLRNEGGRYGFGAGPLYLMGHSAGAHMACMVALDEHYRQLARLDADSVAGIIGLSGVYRLRPEAGSVYADIFAAAAPGFEAVSPVSFVGKNQVPLLLLHGDQDRVVDIGNARHMLEAATSAGHLAELHAQPGYGHARPIFDFLPFMPSHQRTMSLLLAFMSGHAR